MARAVAFSLFLLAILASAGGFAWTQASEEWRAVANLEWDPFGQVQETSAEPSPHVADPQDFPLT